VIAKSPIAGCGPSLRGDLPAAPLVAVVRCGFNLAGYGVAALAHHVSSGSSQDGIFFVAFGPRVACLALSGRTRRNVAAWSTDLACSLSSACT
jgi:hypothetical protein